MQRDRQTDRGKMSEHVWQQWARGWEMPLDAAPSRGRALTSAWDIFTVFPNLLKPELSSGHGFAPD